MNPLKCLLALLLTALTLSASADFAIRDGDTVVFLGDSITAARQYGKIIEDYTLLRFPHRKVRFSNAGKGGETARGSLERLDKDVLDRGATLVTVAYGINDIGWGMKADATHKQEYLDAIGELIDRCKKRGVRVYICSAPITAETPDKAEHGFLQNMCDEGLALAKSKGAGAIDVQREMRKAQRRVLAYNADHAGKGKPTAMHVEDGIHLNDLGQFAMAFAILKGLDAPGDVSAATIDAEDLRVTDVSSCKITGVSKAPDGLSFIRADDCLPLNLAPLWMLNGFYMPIGEELNRYMLTVKNLPTGKYTVTAAGRPIGTWSAEALARGINIASASPDPWQPGGPWDAQAQAVKVFTDMRDELDFARRGMKQTLTANPRFTRLSDEAREIETKLIALQRDMSQPVPTKFVITKAP